MLNNLYIKEAEIIQFPTVNNDYIAVCQVIIRTSSGDYVSIGVAQGTSESEIKGLLEQALEDGLSSAKQKAENSNIQNNQPVSFFEITPPAPTSTNYDKSAGGGENPASVKQLLALTNMYKDPGLDKVVYKKFGIILDELKGYQANILFDEYNEKKKRQ